MRVTSSLLLLALCTASLAAQTNEPGKLGINLRFEQPAGRFGLTWQASPGIAVRPEFGFRWNKVESPLTGTREVTQYSVTLDVLLRAASWDRVTSYVGVGAGFGAVTGSGSSFDGDLFLARAMVGARVKVFERVALFGEIGVSYEDGSDLFGTDFSFETFPIGLVVFLK